MTGPRDHLAGTEDSSEMPSDVDGPACHDMASFQYEPLRNLKECIRVLVLEPGRPGDPLRASLEQVSLDEEPIYTLFRTIGAI